MKPNSRLRKRCVDGAVRTGADHVVAKRDGTVELKSVFFYKHGKTAEMWGEVVMEAMASAGQNVELVTAEEYWKEWPKESYFSAIVRPKEAS